MKSRERVIAALNHEEPDRVPIDFGSNSCTSVNVLAYNRLKKRLGISTPTYVRNIGLMLAAPDMERDHETIRRMGGDLVGLSSRVIDGFAIRDWKPWTLKDGSVCLVPGSFNPERDPKGGWTFNSQGITYRMPEGGHYFDRITCPLESLETLEQLKEIVPFLKELRFFNPTEDDLDELETRAERLYRETDFAIVGDLYGFSLYQLSQSIFGYEKFLTLIASDADFVHHWMNAIAESLDTLLAAYLPRVGKYLNVILMGDDYGHQQGTQISPRMFRELFKPYLTRVCHRAHQLCPHIKVLLHSCGSVYRLIPDFIESGIDGLNPVQTSAREMDPARLKREFGRHLTFWGGGITAQTTLHRGTIDEIEKEVKERIEIFKPGGGYVFSTDHDIQENISAEKIEAVFNTAQQFRAY